MRVSSKQIGEAVKVVVPTLEPHLSDKFDHIANHLSEAARLIRQGEYEEGLNEFINAHDELTETGDILQAQVLTEVFKGN
jgi:hypothetical protein